jgi:hypothetical protein
MKNYFNYTVAHFILNVYGSSATMGKKGTSSHYQAMSNANVVHSSKMIWHFYGTWTPVTPPMYFDTPHYVMWWLLSIFNCNWVDTQWQQYSTHLHTNSIQNTENRLYTVNGGEGCGPCPVFASYTLAFALQLRKMHIIINVICSVTGQIMTL